MKDRQLHVQDYVAVVSDFDDTILDNREGSQGGLHELSRLEALREVGRANGVDYLAKITTQMSIDAIHRAPVHASEGAFWWLLRETGLLPGHGAYDPSHPLIRQLSEATQRYYRQLLVTDARSRPGAQNFFQSLYDHGYAGKLAIASSGHRDDILTFLRSHAFLHLFGDSHVVANEDVSQLKPHPEVYLTALKRLGIPSRQAAQVLAFEDDPRGILAAKLAGLTTCAVTTRFTYEQLRSLAVPPDVVARDFRHYADMLDLPAPLAADRLAATA